MEDANDVGSPDMGIDGDSPADQPVPSVDYSEQRPEGKTFVKQPAGGHRTLTDDDIKAARSKRYRKPPGYLRHFVVNPAESTYTEGQTNISTAYKQANGGHRPDFETVPVVRAVRSLEGAFGMVE